MKARTKGVHGQWLDVDREVGAHGDLGTWNRQPFLVILNEGFDGLRILVWGCENADEVYDAIRDSGEFNMVERFDECDAERGFHHFARVAEVR